MSQIERRRIATELHRRELAAQDEGVGIRQLPYLKRHL